jgi:hypothetical protein
VLPAPRPPVAVPPVLPACVPPPVPDPDVGGQVLPPPPVDGPPVASHSQVLSLEQPASAAEAATVVAARPTSFRKSRRLVCFCLAMGAPSDRGSRQLVVRSPRWGRGLRRDGFCAEPADTTLAFYPAYRSRHKPSNPVSLCRWQTIQTRRPWRRVIVDQSLAPGSATVFADAWGGHSCPPSQRA